MMEAVQFAEKFGNLPAAFRLSAPMTKIASFKSKQKACVCTHDPGLTTSVKIFPYRPLARLIKAK